MALYKVSHHVARKQASAQYAIQHGALSAGSDLYRARMTPEAYALAHRTGDLAVAPLGPPSHGLRFAVWWSRRTCVRRARPIPSPWRPPAARYEPTTRPPLDQLV